MIPNTPSLRIAGVGGLSAPASPLGSFSGPADIVLPSGTPNPVEIEIEATNVPTGTTVQITVAPAAGARISVASNPLAGTLLASTATASIDLQPGLSVLTATAVVELATTAQSLIIDGEQIDRIEIAAVFGGRTRVTYVSRSGRRIDTK
jgi:hypothetical protein